MYDHLFIVQPSSWLGEGKIKLNMVDEELSFYTRWNMGHRGEGGIIECLQEIQVRGVADTMHNQFMFSSWGPHQFCIEMENHAVGRVQGTGIISEYVIGWEFKVPELGFEGFEFYEKQSDNSYLMRAEYTGNEQFRTSINGRIWQPIPQK